ncbi:MAG: (2Fe-2S)-binding protein [Planctomycetes bacterium]|nr:(2Fe-2S)-binding protein [Planctomycetota bacterium]
MSTPEPGGVSRRAMLKGAGAAAFASVLGRGVQAQDGEEAPAQPKEEGLQSRGPEAVEVVFTLNGEETKLVVEPRVTLLDALRDRVGVTGTKRVCDRGACGACTVWLDGATVNACLLLAVDVAGAEVTTIEGLAGEAKLAPIQRAFVQCDAMQCGFCTSGMLMSCAALLRDVPRPTLEQTKHAVVGNLCRCGTYPHVFHAVQEAAQ